MGGESGLRLVCLLMGSQCGRNPSIVPVIGLNPLLVREGKLDLLDHPERAVRVWKPLPVLWKYGNSRWN